MFDGEAGAGESTSESQTDDATTDATTDDAALGDAGKAALQKERDARKAAEKEAERLKKLVDAADVATRKREADEAAAKGEFEKLATERQQEIERLQGEIAERDKAALRDKVGRAHKLPDPLIELLKGDDEAALVAHARELSKHVKPPTAAETEAGAGNRGNGAGSAAQKPGANAEAAKAGAGYAFMPSNAVIIPDGL